MLREWVIQKEEFQLSSRRDKFPDFLKFLAREKIALEYMENSTGKEREVRMKTHHVGKEETEGEYGLREAILKQKQNDETLRKVVEGLTQVIQAVNRPERSRFPSHANNNRKCWYHGSNTHEIVECSAFLALANDKKTEELKKNGACFCCLQLGHLSKSKCY